MPSRCVWDVPYTRRNPQINTPTTRPLREAFSLRRRSPSAQTSGASRQQGRGDGVSTSALFFLEKCGFELNPRGRAQGLGEKRPALCPAELASSPGSRVSAWTPRSKAKAAEAQPPQGPRSHVRWLGAEPGPAHAQTSVEGAGPGRRAPSRLRPTVNAPFPLIVALSCVRAALPQGAPPTPARFCGSALTPVVTQLIRKIRIAREGMLC